MKEELASSSKELSLCLVDRTLLQETQLPALRYGSKSRTFTIYISLLANLILTMLMLGVMLGVVLGVMLAVV